jgi:hypothetical protein
VCAWISYTTIYAFVTLAPCQASPSSCSLNRRTYTPKVGSTHWPKAPLYPLFFSLRFAPLARVILEAASSSGSARLWNGVLSRVKAGMWCAAVKCSSSIIGVAAMTGVDVNKPRTKENTTGSLGCNCTTEHRRLAGGGIGVTTGGRRVT